MQGFVEAALQWFCHQKRKHQQQSPHWHTPPNVRRQSPIRPTGWQQPNTSRRATQVHPTSSSGFLVLRYCHRQYRVSYPWQPRTRTSRRHRTDHQQGQSFTILLGFQHQCHHLFSCQWHDPIHPQRCILLIRLPKSEVYPSAYISLVIPNRKTSPSTNTPPFSMDSSLCCAKYCATLWHPPRKQNMAPSFQCTSRSTDPNYPHRIESSLTTHPNTSGPFHTYLNIQQEHQTKDVQGHGHAFPLT